MMATLRQRRRRQLEHASTAVARDLDPADDLVEIHARFTNLLIGDELRRPFPDWARVHRLALNLVENIEEKRHVA